MKKRKKRYLLPSYSEWTLVTSSSLMKYFADQLEDGKIYKISDIITDKAYKKLKSNKEE